MRTDNDEHSKWFDVTMGLRQGYVLSQLAFDIFFDLVIHAVLVRFSVFPDILRDLAHREEGLGEEPCERSLTSMYADDAGIVSMSEKALLR